MLRIIGLDTEVNRIVSNHLKEIEAYEKHINKINTIVEKITHRGPNQKITKRIILL